MLELSSVPSEPVRPKSERIKVLSVPREVRHFTMIYRDWKAFCNHRTGEMAKEWANELVLHLVKVGICCTIAFQKHTVRLKTSRKRNCNVFTAKGRCTIVGCPVLFKIMVEEEPKNKESPCVFTVVIFGIVNHAERTRSASRHVTGKARVAMGKL